MGVGPAVVFSSYDRTSLGAESAGFSNPGTQMDVSIPFGIVLQDRVRLSSRVALRDSFDGTDSLGGRDIVSNIGIVYRFDLGR